VLYDELRYTPDIQLFQPGHANDRAEIEVCWTNAEQDQATQRRCPKIIKPGRSIGAAARCRSSADGFVRTWQSELNAA
jgi:hypothetical protein